MSASIPLLFVKSLSFADYIVREDFTDDDNTTLYMETDHFQMVRTMLYQIEELSFPLNVSNPAPTFQQMQQEETLLCSSERWERLLLLFGQLLLNTQMIDIGFTDQPNCCHCFLDPANAFPSVRVLWSHFATELMLIFSFYFSRYETLMFDFGSIDARFELGRRYRIREAKIAHLSLQCVTIGILARANITPWNAILGELNELRDALANR